MSVRVIKFYTEYLPNGGARDYVELAPAGDGFATQRTVHQINHIIPPKDRPRNQRQADTHVAMQARWDVVQPLYEAWKNNQDIPEDGTPLAVWSGLTAEMAQYLKDRMGIRTLEQLSELSPDHAAKLPFPNARKYPELAAKYLEGSTAAAKDAQLAEMEKKLAALTAALEDRAEPKKRGPGRPKKEEAEAA